MYEICKYYCVHVNENDQYTQLCREGQQVHVILSKRTPDALYFIQFYKLHRVPLYDVEKQ